MRFIVELKEQYKEIRKKTKSFTKRQREDLGRTIGFTVMDESEAING